MCFSISHHLRPAGQNLELEKSQQSLGHNLSCGVNHTILFMCLFHNWLILILKKKKKSIGTTLLLLTKVHLGEAMTFQVGIYGCRVGP